MRYFPLSLIKEEVIDRRNTSWTKYYELTLWVIKILGKNFKHGIKKN